MSGPPHPGLKEGPWWRRSDYPCTRHEKYCGRSGCSGAPTDRRRRAQGRARAQWATCSLAPKRLASPAGNRSKRSTSPHSEELALAHADGTYTRLLGRLAKIDVLVLDDWGLAPLKDQERRDLLEILEDRHGLRSTVITSQLPVGKWHDHLGDPTIADAVWTAIIVTIRSNPLRQGKHDLLAGGTRVICARVR